MEKKFNSFEDLQKELHPEDHARNMKKKSRKEEAVRKRRMGVMDHGIGDPTHANILSTWALLGFLMQAGAEEEVRHVADQLDEYFEEHEMFSRVAKVTGRGIVFETNKKERGICNSLLIRFGKQHNIKLVSSKTIKTLEEAL